MEDVLKYDETGKIITGVKDRSVTSVVISDGVTGIGEYAFFFCNSLTCIELPNSVTSIGESAFGGCSSLTIINVDASNPVYLSVDGVLFNKEKTIICSFPAGRNNTKYSIPNSVTCIGESAFFSCSSLTNIDVPNTVTSIEAGAFNN